MSDEDDVEVFSSLACFSIEMAAAGIFEADELRVMPKTEIACDDEPGAMLITDKACDKLCRSKALSDKDDVEIFRSLACFSIEMADAGIFEIDEPGAVLKTGKACDKLRWSKGIVRDRKSVV